MYENVNSDRIKIHRRVLPGLGVLSAPEKERFWQAVNSLENFSPDQPSIPNIKLYNPDEGFYVMGIDSSLRIIFHITERDEVEILDLLSQEMIDLNFSKAKAISR